MEYYIVEVYKNEEEDGRKIHNHRIKTKQASPHRENLPVASMCREC
jgi:hypothetical protein